MQVRSDTFALLVSSTLGAPPSNKIEAFASLLGATNLAAANTETTSAVEQTPVSTLSLLQSSQEETPIADDPKITADHDGGLKSFLAFEPKIEPQVRVALPLEMSLFARARAHKPTTPTPLLPEPSATAQPLPSLHVKTPNLLHLTRALPPREQKTPMPMPGPSVKNHDEMSRIVDALHAHTLQPGDAEPIADTEKTPAPQTMCAPMLVPSAIPENTSASVTNAAPVPAQSASTASVALPRTDPKAVLAAKPVAASVAKSASAAKPVAASIAKAVSPSRTSPVSDSDSVSASDSDADSDSTSTSPTPPTVSDSELAMVAGSLTQVAPRKTNLEISEPPATRRSAEANANVKSDIAVKSSFIAAKAVLDAASLGPAVSSQAPSVKAISARRPNAAATVTKVAENSHETSVAKSIPTSPELRPVSVPVALFASQLQTESANISTESEESTSDESTNAEDAVTATSPAGVKSMTAPKNEDVRKEETPVRDSLPRSHYETTAVTSREPAPAATETKEAPAPASTATVARVQEVMDAIKVRVEGTNKVAHIEIGRGDDVVKATIQIEDKRVSVHFVTADPALRSRLETGLVSLSRDLAQRGYQLGTTRPSATSDVVNRPVTHVSQSARSDDQNFGAHSDAHQFGSQRERAERDADERDDEPAVPHKGRRTVAGRTYIR